MLPGYVSGFYTHDECHVDLNKLARYAGAALILETATGLDLQVPPQSISHASHDGISINCKACPHIGMCRTDHRCSHQSHCFTTVESSVCPFMQYHELMHGLDADNDNFI